MLLAIHIERFIGAAPRMGQACDERKQANPRRELDS
jgi:hypothetical protein